MIKNFKKRFKNTFKFCNNEINKFILLLRKGVYPYKDMDEWEKFNEISLAKKEDFYIILNVKEITDSDYNHVKKEFVKILNKNLG